MTLKQIVLRLLLNWGLDSAKNFYKNKPRNVKKVLGLEKIKDIKL
jgi:hypothetical protein